MQWPGKAVAQLHDHHVLHEMLPWPADPEDVVDVYVPRRSFQPGEFPSIFTVPGGHQLVVQAMSSRAAQGSPGQLFVQLGGNRTPLRDKGNGIGSRVLGSFHVFDPGSVLQVGNVETGTESFSTSMHGFLVDD